MFVLCFVFVLYLIVFKNPFDMGPLILLPVSAAFVFLAVFVHSRLERVNLSWRREIIILAVFIVVTGAVQLLIGNRLRFTPEWDMDGVN